MICKNCGNEIRDDARFCPHCGALNSPSMGSGLPEGAAPYGASGYTGPEGPVPGEKKGKTGLLIAGAVAVVAVIAVAAAAVGGLFSSPKKQLEKAVTRTLAAYEQAEKAMGLPDLDALMRERAYRQRMSLELTGITDDMTEYELSALKGLGLRAEGGLNWKDRRMDLELAAFWDDQDIISLQMAAEDNELYFASPQITDGVYYGVDTETLGADLEALGAEDVGDVSFNLFDLADTLLPDDQARTMEQRLKDAGEALWEASQVERDGKETVSVNGQSVSAQGYRVVIPQSALEDYADALAEAMTAVDYVEFYEQILQAAGLPQAEIEEFMDQMEDLDPYGELSDEWKEIAAALGDVRLTVYTSGGRVSVVRYDDRVQGSTVKAELQLGGGGEYADDLSLEVSVDGTRVTVKSSGDHTGKGGAFTDKTTVRAGLSQLSSEFSYRPKDGDLSWSVSIPGAGSLDMAGTLTGTKDSVSLELEELSVTVMGMDILSLAVDYYMGPYEPATEPNSAKLIPDMNGIELMGLVVSLEANAQNWLTQTQQLFASRLPEELLRSLMYG